MMTSTAPTAPGPPQQVALHRKPYGQHSLPFGALLLIGFGTVYLPTFGFPDATIPYNMAILLFFLVFVRKIPIPVSNTLTLFCILLLYSILMPTLSHLVLNNLQGLTGLGSFYYPGRIFRAFLLFLVYIQQFSLVPGIQKPDQFARYFIWLATPHLLVVLLQFFDISGSGRFFREINTYVGQYSYHPYRNYGLMSGVDASGIAVALTCLMQRYRMKSLPGTLFYVALVAMLLITSRTGIVVWLICAILFAVMRIDAARKMAVDFSLVIFAALTLWTLGASILDINWLKNPAEPFVNLVQRGKFSTVSTDDFFNQTSFNRPNEELVFGGLVDPKAPVLKSASGYISDIGYIQIITAIGVVGFGIMLALMYSILRGGNRTVLGGYMLLIGVSLLIAAIHGPVFFGRFGFDILPLYGAWRSVVRIPRHSLENQFSHGGC